MNKKKFTKLLALYLPYLVIGLAAINLGEAWRLTEGKELGDKIVSLMGTLPAAFANPLPSLHPLDILVGICCGAGLRLAVYLKSKNAKKYRHGIREYGRIVFRRATGHSPSLSHSLIASRSEAPSSSVKFSSNRFISERHLCSATSGLGQMISTDSKSSLRACNSRRIRPASMVLPTPTLSATRIRGRSEWIIFRAGRN